MPRYFFDIEDGELIRDEMGIECASDDELRKAVMGSLPEIAADEMTKNGDRRSFSVVVRDDAGRAVYAAVLTFNGMWLRDKQSG